MYVLFTSALALTMLQCTVEQISDDDDGTVAAYSAKYSALLEYKILDLFLC